MNKSRWHWSQFRRDRAYLLPAAAARLLRRHNHRDDEPKLERPALLQPPRRHTANRRRRRAPCAHGPDSLSFRPLSKSLARLFRPVPFKIQRLYPPKEPTRWAYRRPDRPGGWVRGPA